MSQSFLAGLLLAGLGFASSIGQDAAEVAPLEDKEYQVLLDRLAPDPTEPWRTIPWRIDLLDAQREALATERPLFIWAMDGHPLGCT